MFFLGPLLQLKMQNQKEQTLVKKHLLYLSLVRSFGTTVPNGSRRAHHTLSDIVLREPRIYI